MTDFNELRKIVNSSNMSITKRSDGKARVKDSAHFKGMPITKLREIQEIVEESVHEDTKEFSAKCGVKSLDTLKTVNDRAVRNVDSIMNMIMSDKPVTASELHGSFGTRTKARDSFINGRWNIGNSVDPSLAGIAIPNVYISPWEAETLYSQKGVFTKVINKKSKSILLNGLSFSNPKLTAKDIEEIKLRAEVLDFKKVISDSVRDSLCYGGCLTFPLFKRDTPVTTGMPLSLLVKYGVVGKDCIDYFVRLDRWNTLILPPTNPTQKDFQRPEVYTIPFLGSDVHHSRCARIVTDEQAGYLGTVINQGWGISDLCGYLQSGMNYKVTMQSIPLMVQQMSILARTVNVDAILATEGANALDALTEQGTIRTREASVDNPVTLDVLGNLTVINRNFAQLPELVRLERQDFAGDADMPEPMLWSSEKGNFASGDDTEGNLNKQWEAIRMIHKSIEPQIKQLVKVLVIDALGTSQRVMEALPYTHISFDEPVIANALERSQIGKYFSEEIFNLVSAQYPLDTAMEIASRTVSEDLAPSNDLLEQLRSLQKKKDEENDERAELELEMQKTQIEAQKASIEEAGNPETEKKGIFGKFRKPKAAKQTSGKGPAEEEREKALADREKKGYSRLEQKQHERTRVGGSKRFEALGKARGKAVK